MKIEIQYLNNIYVNYNTIKIYINYININFLLEHLLIKVMRKKN